VIRAGGNTRLQVIRCAIEREPQRRRIMRIGAAGEHDEGQGRALHDQRTIGAVERFPELSASDRVAHHAANAQPA